MKLYVCLLAASALFAAEKQYKQGEYEMYKAAADDLGASNFTKAIADLDGWKQKFPESDYADDRQLLFVHAYVGAKQPGQAIDAAGVLLNKDLDAALNNPGNVLTLLFKTFSAIAEVPEPTPAQLATAAKAARTLLSYDKKPDALTGDAWTQARNQLQTAARGALVYVAIQPGAAAIKRGDCAAAESSLVKAVQENPDSVQAAWYLGTAQLCLYKTQPEKASPALYELARAAAIDPAKGLVDPKWQRDTVEPYLEKTYNKFHGADPEGLKQLKETAAAAPLPPANFKIKSAAEIAHEKELEFEKSNPQLALWMKIKGQLADTNGDQYFTDQLKNSAVPQLRGTLVEAKPECRPKELLVAVPLPDAQQPLRAEITLKLDSALTGKPELNQEFHWEGVPSAFSKDPFMLTMDTEKAKIEGLNTTGCAAAPARRGGARRSSAKK